MVKLINTGQAGLYRPGGNTVVVVKIRKVLDDCSIFWRHLGFLGCENLIFLVPLEEASGNSARANKH